MKAILFVLLLSVSLSFAHFKHKNISQKRTVVQVENPILVSRKNETITLSAVIIKKAFPHEKTPFIQVKDLKNNSILTTQSVDYDGDGIPDEFLFQSDFDPKEKKEFEIIRVSKAEIYTSKAYSAFMSSKEGMEDFAWENDCIGYRFYGQERAKLQGTGIAMDIWCKRVPDFLTEKWYVPGQNYHKDTGYGADHYNSGKNQGCGGSGIIRNDTLYFSKPFYDWKIIANGPIRLVFELKFTGWAFDKNCVETKRVTLDAGHYLNKIESRYSADITSLGYKHAVGFVQRDDSVNAIEKELGWFTSWESLGEAKGNLGTGFIALPTDGVEIKNINKHLVGVLEIETEKGVAYYAGAAWDEFGSIHSNKDWDSFIADRAMCIKNPCKVSLKK